MSQRTFASTGCPSRVRLASRLAVLLCAFSLFACAGPIAKDFGPDQVAAASQSDVVVFGKIELLKEGKKNSYIPLYGLGWVLDVVPSRNAGRLFKTGGSRIRQNYNQPFYVLLPSDDYVVMSMSRVVCSHVGFRIPEGVDAAYIGTLSLDVYPQSWGRDVINTSVKDEFKSAVRLFETLNPRFSGKIVKSLMVLDKNIPEWYPFNGGNKPGCREVKSGRGNLPFLLPSWFF